MSEAAKDADTDSVESTPPAFPTLPSLDTTSVNTESVPSEPFMSPLASTEIPQLPKSQVVVWSDTLHSPSLSAFSPCLDPHKDTSFHGKGLRMAMERARLLNKTNRRCLSLLQELTNLYESYAASLTKAGQVLASVSPIPHSSSLSATLSEPLPLVSLQGSMNGWATEKSKASTTIRTRVVLPMQSYLNSHNDSVTGLQQRYLQSRNKCATARQRALNMRHKYLKSVREAEQAISEWKQRVTTADGVSSLDDSLEGSASNLAAATPADPNHSVHTTSTAPTTATVTNPSSPKVSKRVENKLRDIQRLETRYRSRVTVENSCVKQCQRVESMALDSMQQMEEDRLALFAATIFRAIGAQKQALKADVISLTAHDETSAAAVAAAAAAAADVNGTANPPTNTTNAPPTAEKRRKPGFVKMLTPGNPGGGGGLGNSFHGTFEESGAMDADTLGLPEELGKLRDTVRARIFARKERIILAKTLSTFMEHIVKASTKLGNGLRSLMRKDGTSPTDNIHLAMGSCEGAYVLQIWDGLVSFLEAEADGYFAFADSLRNIRAANLDSVILYGEKAMKSNAETDDVMWKQLCDAVRSKARAVNKYKQSSAETARARERVLSLENAADVKAQGKEQHRDGKAAKVGQKMQKGLANIISILPGDGGDKAMKMLGPGARASVAQRGLKEADEKEAKGKQQLDSALEAAAVAQNAYKTGAEVLIARYDEEEKTGWNDVKTTLEAFSDLAQKLLRGLQLDSISDIQQIAKQAPVGILGDINDWRMKAQQELVGICVEDQHPDASAESGFQLELALQQSDAVDDLRVPNTGELTTEDVVDLVDEDEPDEDETDEIGPDTSGEANTSNVSEETAEANGDVKNIFRRQFGPNSSPLSGGRKRVGLGNLRRDNTWVEHDDPETEIFFSYFWPETVDIKSMSNVPYVVDSFACSLRDSTSNLPSLYGRVYLSASRLMFISWSKKKVTVRLIDIRSSSPMQGFDGQINQALQVSAPDSAAVFDGLRDTKFVTDTLEKLVTEAKAAAAEAKAAEEAAAAAAAEPTSTSRSAIVTVGGGGGSVIPPDTLLPDMKLVVQKYLRKITVQRFHEIVWAEKEKPLYEPWLAREAFDIQMGNWVTGSYVGPWCKETYTQERRVNFRVKRRTHLYIGPPIADVSQVHRCRLEGDDRCIVSMTFEFAGMPYGDTFAVEVRWVASREGETDVKVECGLTVNFKKNTFLKKQIQSGTIEESTPVHKSWFNAMEAACIAAGGEKAEEAEVETEKSTMPKEKEAESIFSWLGRNVAITATISGAVLFGLWWGFSTREGNGQLSRVAADVLVQRIDMLELKLDAMQVALDEALRLLREQKKSS